MGVVTRLLVTLAAASLLAACGAQPPARTADSAPALQEAIARVGNITMRASVMQTSALGASVAGRYGIPRADTTVMLLVTVRQGSEGEEIALPARVTAAVTDLRGQRQTIALRALRTGEPGVDPAQALLDYIGTVETTLPETLRFDVSIVREGGATTVLQFTREFYPR